MRVGVARRRAGILLGAVLISLLGLGVRLGYVQGARSDEYGDIANRQRLRHIVLPPTRGAIYDHAGRELALSIPARTLYANPRQITDPEGVARVLAPILDRPLEELTERLHRDKGFVYLARRVDVAVAEKVEGLGLVGVGALDEASRFYPGGGLASTVLGLVGTDAEGLGGLEFGYQDLLGGRPGFRVLEQDPLGRQIPQGTFQEEPPVAGSDLMLTIDRDIQFAAERALGRAVEETGADGGTVVVVDPRTGDILAMANAPGFDPNDPSTIEPDAMRNRAVVDIHEPGSVQKVVTAAAALEEGVVTPDSAYEIPSRYRVGGRDFRDAHPHPTSVLRFDEIIARSSNVGTIKVALALGAERLQTYLERFGFGRATGLGFPGEAAGLLPRTDRWATSLPTMAIGQGVSATALQMAQVYAALANDGVLAEPRLVTGWVDPDGDLHHAPAARTRRVVSAATAVQVREMMAKVVAEGTGTLAAVPGYLVGGKTGTAQKPSPSGGYSGHMASFYGVVPVRSPRLVIGVVLDQPSPIWGGVVAAPVFREVGEAAVRILRIPPDALDGEVPAPEQEVQGAPLD